MHIDILTLFPPMVESFFTSSIMSRAVEKGLVDYRIINFRDFATDPHHKCDDLPYGGGAGMVLKCDPLCKALESIGARDKRVIYPSPSGRLFTQSYAQELSGEVLLDIEYEFGLFWTRRMSPQTGQVSRAALSDSESSEASGSRAPRRYS